MKPYYDDGNGIVIYHGDCMDVMREIASTTIDAVVTDPPYGIDYQSAWRIDRSAWKPKIANDGLPFIWWLYNAARVVKEVSSVTCFCRWDVQETFRIAIDTAGFDIQSQVIWDREVHGMGDLNGSFAPQHDVIWFGTRGKFKFSGSRPKSVVRSMRLGGEQLVHPNEKPVELMQQLVAAVANTGAAVLDPFAGSGSTLVAAKACGASAIGIEIEERYCEIAAKRLAQGVLEFKC